MAYNTFRTIVNKHPNKCRRCGVEVPAGTSVRWLPGRGIWHMADKCAGKVAK